MSLSSITVPPRRFRKTLVYYYMPGCPFCVQFTPVYLQLVKLCGKLMKKFCKLRAVNITKHDNVWVPVTSVPTVIYFNKRGMPRKMQASSAEDRTLVKLAKFYRDQSLMDR